MSTRPRPAGAAARPDKTRAPASAGLGGESAVTLLDTGPLVALLDRTEKEHARVAKQVESLAAPFLTVEPVLTEACFLLRQVRHGPETVMKLVHEGLLSIGLSVAAEAAALEVLMKKYADVPMSLADACLVRLAERQPRAVVFTLDRDFEVYRAHRRQPLELLGLPKR